MIRKLMKKPEIGVITSLIIVFALFGVMSKGAFLSIGVLKTVFAVSVELGIVAIGVTHVLVAAEIDLSVGSIYGFSALMFAKMYKMLSPGLAAIVVLVLGMGIGFANGYIRVKTRVPSLIVTLGSMMTLRGIIYFVTGGFTQSVKASFFTKILGSDILDPLWLILVAFIFTVVLTRTPFGNRLLATGGNIETARTLGVKVDKIRVVAFMISSTLASLAGLISISRLRVASATHGELMELEAIAAAVMGGNTIDRWIWFRSGFNNGRDFNSKFTKRVAFIWSPFLLVCSVSGHYPCCCISNKFNGSQKAHVIKLMRG